MVSQIFIQKLVEVKPSSPIIDDSSNNNNNNNSIDINNNIDLNSNIDLNNNIDLNTNNNCSSNSNSIVINNNNNNNTGSGINFLKNIRSALRAKQFRNCLTDEFGHLKNIEREEEIIEKMSLDSHLKPPTITCCGVGGNNTNNTNSNNNNSSNVNNGLLNPGIAGSSAAGIIPNSNCSSNSTSPSASPGSSFGSTARSKLHLNLNLSSIMSRNSDADSASQHSPLTPTSSLRTLFGVATSPRRSSPRAFGSFASSAPSASSNAVNLHHLPRRLLDMIFSQVIDFVLPSAAYVEYLLINRQLQRAIESIRGFVLVLGISPSHTAASFRWFQRHHQRVSKIKFISEFFEHSYSPQLLDTLLTLDSSPSLDFSSATLSGAAVRTLTHLLFQPSCSIYQLNLAGIAFGDDVGEDAVAALTDALAQCKNVASLDLSVEYSINNNPSNGGTPDAGVQFKLYRSIPSAMEGNQTIQYLNLGGLNIGEQIAIQFATALRRLSTLQTLIYNHNPHGIQYIVESLTIHPSICILNLACCQLFTTPQRVSLFTALLKQNTVITDLVIHHNSFTNHSREIIDALAQNTAITSVDLSYTATLHADSLLFPLIPSLLTSNHTIKTLLLNNNLPFPEPAAFSASANLCLSPNITTLSLARLKMGDDRFVPLIQALATNNTLTSLDLSINRLHVSSAHLIADYFQHNQSLAHLNLGFNFLKTGVKKICQSLQSNTSLRTLNLHATQIHRNEAKALAKLLQHNKSLTELDVGYNIHIDPIILTLCSNSSIKSLHIRSASLKSSFVRLLQRNQTLTYIDITDSTYKTTASISSALLKNRTILKLNFSLKDQETLKLLANNLKLSTRIIPNKCYYFK